MISVHVTPSGNFPGKHGWYIGLPIDEADLYKKMLELGIDVAQGDAYELRYDSYYDELKFGNMDFCEQCAVEYRDEIRIDDDIFELNRNLRLFAELSPSDKLKVNTLVITQREDFRDAIDRRDNYLYIPDIKSDHDLGKYMILRSGILKNPSELSLIEDFFNFDGHGKSIRRTEWGVVHELLGYSVPKWKASELHDLKRMWLDVQQEEETIERMPIRQSEARTQKPLYIPPEDDEMRLMRSLEYKAIYVSKGKEKDAREEHSDDVVQAGDEDGGGSSHQQERQTLDEWLREFDSTQNGQESNPQLTQGIAKEVRSKTETADQRRDTNGKRGRRSR